MQDFILQPFKFPEWGFEGLRRTKKAHHYGEPFILLSSFD